jgi:hypothetical protein
MARTLPSFSSSEAWVVVKKAKFHLEATCTWHETHDISRKLRTKPIDRLFSTYSIGPESLDSGDEHGLALGINDLSVDHDLPRRLDVRVESAERRKKASHQTPSSTRDSRSDVLRLQLVWYSLDDETIVPHVLPKPRITPFFPLSELEPGRICGSNEVEAEGGRLIQLSVDGVSLGSGSRAGMFDLL